jgi:hypothetical protein
MSKPLAHITRAPLDAKAMASRRWMVSVGVALLAIPLTGGASRADCGRCGRSNSPAPVSATVFAAPRSAVVERSWIRTTSLEVGSKERRKEKAPTEAASGSSIVCVSVCDGSFFPVPYSGAATSLEKVCKSLCPNADVVLYSFPFGGTIDQAVSATGETYAHLPSAHRFEQSFDPSCSCRAPGQSWAEALAPAEAKYGRHSHDILVNAADADRMSRPAESAKGNPAVGPQPDAAPQIVLDANGVDTALSAAMKTISHETSGVRDQVPERPASFGLRQGQTVEETDSEGSIHKVRVLPTSF